MDNIGKILRQARIDKGMTIDDLQKKTRIQKRYLIAIENGDFDQLPGQFYVKAFVRQYGEQVGVDTDRYFVEPSQNKKSTGDLNSEINVSDNQDEKLEDEKPVSASPYLTRQQPPSRWHSLIPQILVISAVVLVIFVVWFFYQKSNNTVGISDKGKVTSNSISKISNSSKKSSNSVSSSSSQSSKQSSREKSSSTKSIEKTTKISLKAQNATNYTYEVTDLKENDNKIVISSTDGNSWDRVLVDGSAVFTGTVQAGQSQTVTIPDGAKSITITLGATGNSKVNVNDQEVDLSSNTSAGVSNLILNIVSSEKDE